MENQLIPRYRWRCHQRINHCAFQIILEDENVEGILVNIFGGIIRCDMVAMSVIEASKELGLEVPLVVRFSGANHEEERRY